MVIDCRRDVGAVLRSLTFLFSNICLLSAVKQEIFLKWRDRGQERRLMEAGGKNPARTIGKNNAKDEWRGICAINCGPSERSGSLFGSHTLT